MERIGIFEMIEMKDYSTQFNERQLVSELMKQATKSSYATSIQSIAFLTLLENDFNCIPEGFTAVYMRDVECQIVPNDLVGRIKDLSVKGFEYIPEDFELHLFENRWSPDGDWLNTRIIEMVCHWMDVNL